AEPRLMPCRSGPRRGKSYPVDETRLDGNERADLNECIDTNWISSRGPFVTRFERAFAAEAGAEFGVACASGTAALHLTLAALGLGPGDEVIVPAFTMVATANAVRYVGATLKLVDSEPVHFNLDPDRVEAAITPRTKAIVAVHVYGHPAEMRRLLEIARAHGLHLIEDAAEAHGAEIGGRRVGGFGRAAAFSFYANKIVTCGEGGMVTTNDAHYERVVRRLRDHAFSPERHFWHEYVGFNYRMTNLQAAVGLAQTERLDAITDARRRLRAFYDERLRSIPGVELPAEAPGVRSVFWMYAIRIRPAFGCNRDALRDELARRGVETRSFFIPMHFQPIYFAQFRGQRFPVAEALCESGLYLPTSETLGERDVNWICAQIADIHRLAAVGTASAAS
ncbi:MAG: DegT/DnrJ/EryC1/StrS family aminotransferase, partial [Alphaproteobacteria bacterium]